MASADLKSASQYDWPLANPWPYALVGFVSSFLALGVTQLLGPQADFLRGLFWLVGVFSMAAALILRLNSSGPAFLDRLAPGARGPLLLLLALLFGAAALGMTALLVMSIMRHELIPWRWGSVFVVWAVIAPMTAFACRSCLNARGPETDLPWGHEAACLLLLTGIAFLACAFSLYFGHELRHYWITMRLFMTVGAFAAFICAPFFLVGPRVRRWGLSALFVLHFGGIATAATTMAPAPWILNQLWVRIYRPYLEFTYLVNAYHYYAPEPNTSGDYVWFRLFYEDEAGRRHMTWYKIPEVDEDGWHKHTVALEYQRHLSLTQNVAMGLMNNVPLFDNSAHPDLNTDDDGRLTYNMLPSLKKRWRHSDVALVYKKQKEHVDKLIAAGKEPDLGKHEPKKVELSLGPPISINPFDYPRIAPFAPGIGINEQFLPPNKNIRYLLQSYVRHVAGRPHPPGWTLTSVKVYFVRHVLVPIDAIRNGDDPQDPLLYRPYFMGEFYPDGNVLNTDDPFLFWMLPIVRDPGHPKKLTASFALRHAEDPNWAARWENERWVWFAPKRETFAPRVPVAPRLEKEVKKEDKAK